MLSLRAAPFAALLVGIAASFSPADEASDKQKVVAEDNLKKLDLKKPLVVETENLIFCGPLADARAKVVADALQKAYKVARKGLQFEEKEEPWKGKLTIYYLPGKVDYNQFLRGVAGLRPEGSSHIATRGDTPYVVGGVELTEKSADADIAGELSRLVGGALLMAKAGSSTPVPAWVQTGFGRAAALRAEGPNGKRFPTYKAQSKAAVLGAKGRPAPIADVWGGDRPDADLLATNLMDYMAFGPGQANFPRFLTGLRPGENGEPPTIAATLEAAGWKADSLEAAWKKWVQAGMPEAKTPMPK